MHWILSVGVAIIAVATVGGYFLLGEQVSTTSTPNLEAFVELTKEDPLFYSPFFDTQSFMGGIAALRERETELLAHASENVATSSRYHDLYAPLLADMELFPTAFLEKLPKIHEETNQFLDAPTTQGARELLEHYAKAAESYRAAAEAQRVVLGAVLDSVSREDLVLYLFPGNATHVDIAYEDLVTIEKNAAALVAEVEARRACLSGSGPCDITRPRSGALAEYQKKLTREFDGSQYDAQLLAFVRESLPWAHYTLDEVAGPYSIQSACHSRTATTSWMYLAHYTGSEGQPMVVPKLATENYYNPVPEDAEDVFFGGLRERGLPYYSRIVGFTYECSDLTFYPELLTLDHMAGRREVLEGERGARVNDSQLTSLAENQFGLLAPYFYTLADNLELLIDSQKASGYYTATPHFLIATRSGYSVTYMPYARSVWRIDDELSYFIPDEPGLAEYRAERAPRLTDLRDEGYTYEEIRDFHVDQNAYIKTLMEK